MRYYQYPRGRRPRNRLRKIKKGMALASYQTAYSRGNSLRVYHSSLAERHKYEGPLWGRLRRAWVGLVISKSEYDCEKVRKYVIAIRKFERLLNIEISEFLDLELYNFEEYENEEDDGSKLAVIDPFTNEKIQDAKEDEDEYVEIDFDSL
jgi:hypothetical protein